MDEVAAAELHGVHSDRAPHQVHHLLPGHRFRVPRAPVGAAPAGVGEHRTARPRQTLHAVGAGEHGRHEEADRPSGGEGAGILQVVKAHAHDATLVVDAHGDLQAVGAGVASGDEVLPPVLDPLERQAQVVGGHHDGDLLGAHGALLAEAPADVALAHPDPVVRQTGHPGRCRPNLVHPLAGAPDAQLAFVRIPPGDDPVGLHRDLGLAVLVEGGTDHVRRRRQRLLQLGVVEALLLHHVGRPLRMDEVGAFLRRLLGVEDGREHLVLHLDELARVLRQVAVVGDHQGDRLAGEADVAVGQRTQGGDGRLQEHGGGKRAVDQRAQIIGGEHRTYARRLPGGRSIQPGDPGAGHVAAHEGHVAQARHGDIVHVHAVAGEQAGVLQSLHRLADEAAGDQRHGTISPPVMAGPGSCRCARRRRGHARRP